MPLDKIQNFFAVIFRVGLTETVQPKYYAQKLIVFFFPSVELSYRFNTQIGSFISVYINFKVFPPSPCSMI